LPCCSASGTSADEPAYLLGRVAHTLILEGRVAYERAFAVGGPINPRTGQPFGAGTKAFAEWAASTGREGLDDSQASLVERMAEGVAIHEEASRLLAEGHAACRFATSPRTSTWPASAAASRTS
jgi:hypothetical protein